MFAALKQFFNALTMYFFAFEKSASAVTHLATWADESAGSFADKARYEREAALLEFKQQHEARMKQLQTKATKAPQIAP